MNILNITTDTFVPADAAATGTVTTFGEGFTTSESNQVKVGDFITDASQKESRRVEWVERDGVSGRIKSAFTSDLSAVTLRVISKEDAKIINLSIAADQGSDTRINNKTITAGTSVNAPTGDLQGSLGYGFVNPIYVEGSTVGACTALITPFRNQK